MLHTLAKRTEASGQPSVPEGRSISRAVSQKYTIIGSVARELLIYALYKYEAIRQLRPIAAMKGPMGRAVLRQVLIFSAVITTLDILHVRSLFARGYKVAVTYPGIMLPIGCAILSIKIKVEFTILNKLLELLGAPKLTDPRVCLICRCATSIDVLGDGSDGHSSSFHLDSIYPPPACMDAGMGSATGIATETGVERSRHRYQCRGVGGGRVDEVYDALLV
ncbi:uncharacterized protein BDV14DRAFT_197381 [Aspergillus stella-maris]|uniref:uncharacterized protein n=1 Tax=Aspergillus stella-maris TaxID=1810926 RepID=UPI003CCD1518